MLYITPNDHNIGVIWGAHSCAYVPRWPVKNGGVGEYITIEQTDKTKFLRIIINQNLTWTDYFSLLKNKISKNIDVIGWIRKNLPLYTLRMLCYALIPTLIIVTLFGVLKEIFI